MEGEKKFSIEKKLSAGEKALLCAIECDCLFPRPHGFLLIVSFSTSLSPSTKGANCEIYISILHTLTQREREHRQRQHGCCVYIYSSSLYIDAHYGAYQKELQGSVSVFSHRVVYYIYVCVPSISAPAKGPLHFQWPRDNSLSLENKGRPKARKEEIKGRRGVWNTSKSGRREGKMKKKPPPLKKWVRDITRISNYEMYWPCGAFCWNKRRWTLFLDSAAGRAALTSSSFFFTSYPG